MENKITNIILAELATDKLKYEEELERILNLDNISINKKITLVKKLLNKITKLESMIAKLAVYIGHDSSKN